MAGGDPTEIGLVLYSGVQLAAVHGLTDLLGIADRLAAAHMEGRPALRVTHWQPDPTAARIACVYDTCPQLPNQPEFIVVPLSLVGMPQTNVVSCIVGWLRARHASGATIASVCSGVFLLAESGLLAGRAASTHWSCAEELSARFPDIRVDIDARIVDGGDIITAGGFMAWVDLGLRLVDRLLGPTVALETARYLLVDTETSRQRYFTGFTPRLSHGDKAVLRAQHWIHGRDARDVSLGSMAEQARLETRTFLRRFAVATGMTPMEYCRRLRIARARELLEFSNKTVKEIAWATGYDSADTFARAFRRVAGLSPGDYRRQFRVGRTPAAPPLFPGAAAPPAAA